ncbi:MAG TPA: GAF domain-containing protein [Anaerolineales bacterium]|nr:GAF domain-containing protein [Anaerolineales bacterium]
MESFYQQVIGLLTTPPGNLAYHLVLAFSIAGALPGALNLWRNGSTAGRRMLAGLALLLLAQLVLMATAGLAQFFFGLDGWLPPLDRAVTALSLILFIWLWAFPQPNRMPDFATLLLTLLVLVLFLLTGVWWTSQTALVYFNGSLPDVLWTSFTLLLALAGGLVLLVRRPAGFEIGLAQFVLISLGLALYLLAPLPQGDYPGAIRLAQMAAYPLLLTLPFRFSHEADEAGASDRAWRAGIQPDNFQAFLLLAGATGSQEICRSLTLAIARALPADLCLLLSPPDGQKNISIHCGYQLEKTEWLGSATFDGGLVPVLSEALRQGRPLHLPANGNLPDLTGLSQVLNLPLFGALLAAPVASPVGDPLLAIVVISNRSKRSWSASDQNYLAEIARALPPVLQRSQERLVLGDELTRANRNMQRLQTENDRLARALQDSISKEKNTAQEADDLRAQLRTALQDFAQSQSEASGGDHAHLLDELPASPKERKRE